MPSKFLVIPQLVSSLLGDCLSSYCTHIHIDFSLWDFPKTSMSKPIYSQYIEFWHGTSQYFHVLLWTEIELPLFLLLQSPCYSYSISSSKAPKFLWAESTYSSAWGVVVTSLPEASWEITSHCLDSWLEPRWAWEFSDHVVLLTSVLCPTDSAYLKCSLILLYLPHVVILQDLLVDRNLSTRIHIP